MDEVNCYFALSTGEERKIDLKFEIERVNHNLASSNSNRLIKLVKDDIVHGFQLPLSSDSGHHVVGFLALRGIAHQHHINELVEITKKDRLTHGLLFNYTEGKSLNNRLTREDLPSLRCGSCLSQLLHCIHVPRCNHPDKIIVASKIDLKSAHRSARMNGSLVAMCLTIVG